MIRLGARGAAIAGQGGLGACFAQFVDVLGKTFVRASVDEKMGRVASDEETALGMALYHGLVEGPLAARVAE